MTTNRHVYRCETCGLSCQAIVHNDDSGFVIEFYPPTRLFGSEPVCNQCRQPMKLVLPVENGEF